MKWKLCYKKNADILGAISRDNVLIKNLFVNSPLKKTNICEILAGCLACAVSSIQASDAAIALDNKGQRQRNAVTERDKKPFKNTVSPIYGTDFSRGLQSP